MIRFIVYDEQSEKCSRVYIHKENALNDLMHDTTCKWSVYARVIKLEYKD